MVRVTEIILRLLFAAMFIYSGWSKLSDPVEFQRTLYKYRMFSDGIIPFFTYYVPILELTLSLALLIPQTCAAALRSTFLMLIVFTVALSTLVYRGIDADCGCLGSLGSTPSTAIIRNVILIVLLIFLIRRSGIDKKNEIDDSPLYQ